MFLIATVILFAVTTLGLGVLCAVLYFKLDFARWEWAMRPVPAHCQFSVPSSTEGTHSLPLRPTPRPAPLTRSWLEKQKFRQEPEFLLAMSGIVRDIRACWMTTAEWFSIPKLEHDHASIC
jgi:hypothetical protein